MAGKNSDSIKVAIKVRPLLAKEKDCLWKVTGNSIQPIEGPGEPYYFDYIFDQNATNQMIFENMGKNVVHSVIKGFNGTIFAYGQTSSGKTYTMMGDEENPGVITMAVKEIFKEIQKAKDRQFLLRVGYIEIYNEKLCDLLNKKNTDLKIHESNGFVNVNCEEIIILNEDDVLYHLNLGNKERTVGETKANERSSRSHAIFRIIIESRKIDRTEEDSVTQSVLNLVDLAGSERADQTGAIGSRLKEGAHINKSLLFLGTVIKRLSENDLEYISYRDSKLTRILQASLGGNALTSIICTIKPNALEETQSTLSFAMRAKVIKNKPIINETVSDATMMKRLEKEIKELKVKLDKERKKNESQKKIGDLEMLLKTENLKIITCNSLQNHREIRRRTWGGPDKDPDPTNPYSERKASVSRLPKPRMYLTPMITLKPTREEYESEINNGFPNDIPEVFVEDEEFMPAELCSFSSGVFKTPNAKASAPKTCLQTSITPKAPPENFEEAYLELQEFTNLEKNLGVEHEVYEALNKQLDEVLKRNDRLEKDRRDYILAKDELFSTKERLEETEQCCKQLENEINRLEAVNAESVALIEKYDLELKKSNEQLKSYEEKLKILEIENQKAVGYEFELESYKNKAKLREVDLVNFINERNQELEKLQATINKLIEEKNQYSKEQLTQKVKSVTNSSGIDTDQNNDLICVKCRDLQQLLDENKKIELEFDKLSLNYKELENQLNHAKNVIINLEAKVKGLEETNILQKEQVEVTFCKEIAVLKENLEKLQKDNDRIDCDNKEKTGKYMELEASLTSAKEEMRMLRTQYKDLQTSWQEQQRTIESMRNAYSIIEKKYQQLLIDYDKSVESVRSQEDCMHLQTENRNIQTDIEELKQRVEEAQNSLLADNNRIDCKGEEEVKNLEQTIINLNRDLTECKKQFEDLQQDYDVLSNQLIESIQENDTLKSTYSILQEQFEKLRDETEKAITNNHENIPTPIINVHSVEEIVFAEATNGVENDDKFNTQIEGLKAKIVFLEKEIKAKDLVLKTTERNILALQKQMTALQAELLEKSTYVEKCEKMRSQIEQLEKEKSEISMDFEDLQEKIGNMTFEGTNISSFNNTNENNESIFEQVDLSQSKSEMLFYKNVLNEFEVLKTFFLNMKKDFLDPEVFNDVDEEEDLELPAFEEKLLIPENDYPVQLSTNKEVKPPLMQLKFRKSCNDLKEGLIESYKIQSKYKAKFQKLRKELESALNDKEELLKQNQIKINELEISYQNACTEKVTLYESELSKLKETILQFAEQNEKLLSLEAKLQEKEKYIDFLTAEHEKQIKDIENKNQCESRNQINEEGIKNIELSFYHKLQESEDQFRENFNKVKADWEREKDHYINTINELNKLLSDSEAKLKSEMKSDTQQIAQEEDVANDDKKMLEVNKNEESVDLQTYNKLSEDYNAFKQLWYEEKESLHSLINSMESKYKQAQNEKEIIQSQLNQQIVELQKHEIESEDCLKSVEDSCNTQLPSNYEKNIEESPLNLNKKLESFEAEINSLKELLQCTENEKETLTEYLRKLIELFAEVNFFKSFLGNVQIDLLEQFRVVVNGLTFLKDSFEKSNTAYENKTLAFIDFVKNLQVLFLGVQQQISFEIKAKECLQKCLEEKQEKLNATEEELVSMRQSIDDYQNKLKIVENIKIKYPNVEKDYETFQKASQDLEDLTNDFAKLQNENKQLKVDNNEMRTKSIKLEQDLEAKSLELQNEKDHLEELKEKLRQLQESNDQLEELKINFNNLQKTNKELADFELKFSEILESHKDIELKHLQLQEANNDLEMRNTKLQEENNVLEEFKIKFTQLEENNKEFAGMKENLSKLKEENNRLKEYETNYLQLQDSNKDLERFKDEYWKLEDSYGELERKVIILNDENEKLKNDVLQLENDYKELQANSSKLYEENLLLQEIHRSFQELQKINKELEDFRIEYNNKYLKLEEENDELKQYKVKFLQLNKTNKELEKFKENFLQLQKSYKEIEMKSLELSEENIKLQETIISQDPLRDALQELRTKYSQLEEDNKQVPELKAKSIELNETNLKLQELKSKFMMLKSENEQLLEYKTKCGSISEDKDKLLKECMVLKDSLHKYEEDIKELQKIKETHDQCVQQTKSFEEQIESLQHENSSFISQLEMLKCSKNNLLATNAELLDSLAALKEGKDILEKRLNSICDADKDRTNDIEGLQELTNQLKNEKEVLNQTIASLTKENLNMSRIVKDLENQKSNLIQSNEELNCQYEASKKLAEKIETKLHSTQKMLDDSKDLQELTNQLKNEKEVLNQTIASLTEENLNMSRIVKDLEMQKSKLIQSNEELNCQYEASKKLTEEIETKLHSMEKRLEKNSQSLEESDKKLQEQALRIQTLNADKIKLEVLTKAESQEKESLRMQLQNAMKTINDDYSSWENEKQNVQSGLEELKSKIEYLEKVNHSLKTSLETELVKHKDLTERLNATVTCLMEEKKNLEEKVLVLEEIVKKSCAKDHLSSSFTKTESENSSLDSIVSDRNSLSPHRKATAMKKSDEKRHQKRLSLHDDNRRRSYFNPAKDVATMTDPIDESCKCSELDEKLRDCQKDLFIRESQVKALNMELKNHPLKSENVALQKRFQEEQDKHRNEIKRFHQKLAEYKEKVTELTSLLANSTPDVSLERKITVVANAECQTEFEQDLDLKILQTKYDDLKGLLRHRANTIRELQEKLSQNENQNERNQLSALENGQINAYKSRYIELKTEMKTLQKKYELAKQVLHLRKEEICRLRGQENVKTDESEDSSQQ